MSDRNPIYSLAVATVSVMALVWHFVGYPLLMGMVSERNEPDVSFGSFEPFVTVIVPTYNEEEVIRDRIENLVSQDYPDDRYEIVVVDSASTDRTAERVGTAEEEYRGPLVTLLEEEQRQGKGSAINFAKANGRGEVMLVTDANATFEPDVVGKLAAQFEDPSVGGATGRSVLANPESSLTAATAFYYDLEYMMSRGEAAIDSPCTFYGEINAWRPELIEADTRMISEDFDMAIQIKTQGYRIAYDPTAIAYDPEAETSNEQIRTKKRRTVGTIQALVKHWRYFAVPADSYRSLIMPSRRGLPMLSPFLVIATGISYLFVRRPTAVVAHAAGTAGLAFVGFRQLLAVRSRIVERRGNTDGGMVLSPAVIVNLARYVLLNEWIVLLAWKDYLLGGYSVLWEKSRSDRT